MDTPTAYFLYSFYAAQKMAALLRSLEANRLHMYLGGTVNCRAQTRRDNSARRSRVRCAGGVPSRVSVIRYG